VAVKRCLFPNKAGLRHVKLEGLIRREEGAVARGCLLKR